MFNAANAPLLPALRAARIPVARYTSTGWSGNAQWGPTGERYYLANEHLSVLLLTS